MNNRQTRGVCRLCEKPQPVPKCDWLHAGKPRCMSCGGMLDRKGMWGGAAKVTQGLTPRDISYPGEATEFEVQAFLYTSLKLLGLDVRGCVPASGGADVFDLVVYSPERTAARIIEVKKANRKALARQLKRYSRYGVPVDEVCGMREAKRYVASVAAGDTGLLAEPPIPTVWGVVG
jgi:hypothetical protein